MCIPLGYLLVLLRVRRKRGWLFYSADEWWRDRFGRTQGIEVKVLLKIDLRPTRAYAVRQKREAGY